MDATGFLILGAGVGIGFGAGIVFVYFTAVKDLVDELRTMRFAGWATVAQVERAKTLPPYPKVRED